MIRAALAAALVLAAPPLSAAESEDLRALRARLESLRTELGAAEDRREEAADALRESERAISEVSRTLGELAAGQQRVQAEQARLAEALRRGRAELDSRAADLGRIVHARYTAGSGGALRVLLGGDSPSTTARRLAYFEYLSRAKLALLDRLRTDLAALAALERSAADKASELAALGEAAARERRALAAQQAERRQTLTRLAAQLQDQRREVRRLERDETRLAKLAQEIARALRGAPPRDERPARNRTTVPDAGPAAAFSQLKGRLRLPVKGELTGRYGTPRQDGGGVAKGLFIAAPEGEQVRAVASGRVVFADWMRGFGNLLILDHGESFLTIYGNNEAVLKRLGDAVHAGETVAVVGSTGGAETSGLYFEIRHQGRPFDPLPWVSVK